jgi:hypothetical protein
MFIKSSNLKNSKTTSKSKIILVFLPSSLSFYFSLLWLTVRRRKDDSDDIIFLKSISTVDGFESLLSHHREQALSLGTESTRNFGLLRIHLEVIDGTSRPQSGCNSLCLSNSVAQRSFQSQMLKIPPPSPLFLELHPPLVLWDSKKFHNLLLTPPAPPLNQ